MSRTRTYDEWETTAVTALPTGWRNVYRATNGRTHSTPCPALLLQERRTIVHVHEEQSDAGTFVLSTQRNRLDAPYETRTVFGEVDEFTTVSPAEDTSNYAGTWGPGEPIPEIVRDSGTGGAS